jgi:hypothetical protein
VRKLYLSDSEGCFTSCFPLISFWDYSCCSLFNGANLFRPNVIDFSEDYFRGECFNRCLSLEPVVPHGAEDILSKSHPGIKKKSIND